MTTPQILDWSARFGFGSPRPVDLIRNIFIHTTENAFGTPAENVANYQLRTETGSYHYLVDNAKLIRENTDDWLTWSTGNKGNDIGLHISFVAYAHYTRAQWLEQRRMLDRGAWQVARWCRTHKIPPVFVDRHGLLRGERGISTHDAARVWGGTDHTDPGAGFPMDVFISLVKKHLAAADQPAKKEPSPMTAFHQITERFKSRVPGSSVTMRPIDALLNIDRHAWETRQRVADIEKKLDKLLENKEV